MVTAADGWGTWEELLLGGAVLRHGTGDWNVVALEIRTRTLYPTAFTPQACKERFQELQKRYHGSTAWFDELRKQRVAELKQELAKSENSIGSLESKIKYLEVEKQHSNQGLSETESRLPALDSESISRQTSNDVNSVGSFTKKTGTSRLCSQEVETDTKPSIDQDNGLCIEKFPEMGYGCSVIMKKKRGQRKRKQCIKERSIGESDNLGSSSIVVSTAPKEASTNDNERTFTSGTFNGSRDSLIQIFQSVAESEPASVFKHRMDSQKRARYRRVIKQHMDIGTIRSRIMGQSIKSTKELFLDLLLLANNALVFYSRRTREYKSAVSLRLLVMKEYKQFLSRGHCHEATSAFIPCHPPVKPRSVRPRPLPCKHKLPRKSSETAPPTSERKCDSDGVSEVSKRLKVPGKVKPAAGLVDASRRTTPVKQSKRVGR